MDGLPQGVKLLPALLLSRIPVPGMIVPLPKGMELLCLKCASALVR